MGGRRDKERKKFESLLLHLLAKNKILIPEESRLSRGITPIRPAERQLICQSFWLYIYWPVVKNRNEIKRCKKKDFIHPNHNLRVTVASCWVRISNWRSKSQAIEKDELKSYLIEGSHYKGSEKLQMHLVSTGAESSRWKLTCNLSLILESLGQSPLLPSVYWLGT